MGEKSIHYKDKFDRPVIFIFSLYLIVRVFFAIGIMEWRPIYGFISDFLLSLFLISFNFINIKNSETDKNLKIIIWTYFLYTLVIELICIEEAEIINQKIVFFSHLPSFFFPLFIFSFLHTGLLTGFLKFSYLFWFPAFCITLLYLNYSYVPYYIINIYILFVFLILPVKNNKTNIAILAVLILSLQTIRESRAVVLVNILSILLYLVYKFKLFRKKWKWISKIIFFFPIVMVILALTIGYNFIQDITAQNDEIDTKTFLYKDVSTHIEKNNAYLFGTPGKGYESQEFSYIKNIEGHAIRRTLVSLTGRFGVEVGILVLYLNGGLLGILLLSILFYYVIWYAFKHSKNNYCRYVALLLSLRYAYLYLDGLMHVYIDIILLAMMMAICMNKELLEYSDKDFKHLFRNIRFPIQY